MPFQTTPNLADFTTFIGDQGVPAAAITVPGTPPTTTPWVGYAFDYGVNWTFQDPAGVVAAITYVIACYNLGLHWLLRNCPDQNGESFFATQRSTYNLTGFVAGAVLSAGDQGTSQSLAGSEGVRNLSLVAMGLLKTPWGQQYLEYAQAYGPNIVAYS